MKRSLIYKFPTYGILIFIIVITTGYIKLPCHFIELIKNNILVKQFLILVSIVTAVSLTINSKKTFKQLIFNTIYIYILFLMLSKIHYLLFMGIILLQVISFIIILYMNYLKDNKNVDIFIYINNIIFTLTIFCFLFGYLHSFYFILKKNNYKLNYIEYIFGDKQYLC
jgi:hypothetical protein